MRLGPAHVGRSAFVRWVCGDHPYVMSGSAPGSDKLILEPPVNAMRAIELRVHGVSGTTPEALLDRQSVSQVAGDKIAGFYRPRLESERTDQAPNPFAPRQERAPELEGYNWGGLTSGSPGRALWLLLLPFTLINVAPRARPNDVGSGATSRTWWLWYLSRVVALLLTLLFVLGAIGVGEDLVGWQCRKKGLCSDSLPGFFLTWLQQRGSGVRFASDLGPLFVSALLPGAVLFLLWFISGRTVNKYEQITVKVHDPQGVGLDATQCDELEVPLTSPWMWLNQDQVRRLRAVHIQSGLALILWTLTVPTQKRWGSAHTDTGGLLGALETTWLEVWSHLWSLLPASILVYGIVVLGRRTYVGRAKRCRWHLASWASWLFLLFLTIHIGWVELRGAALHSTWLDHRGPHTVFPTRLPGFDATLLAILVPMAISLMLILALVGVGAHHHDARSADESAQAPLPPGLGGWTTTAMAILAALLGAAFSAAVYSFGATWLNTGSLKPSHDQVSKALKAFDLPEPFRVATMAVVVSVAAAVVIFLIVGVGAFLGLGPGGVKKVAGVPAGALKHDYRKQAGAFSSDKRTRSIERAVFVATFVERIPKVAAWLVGVGATITLGFGVLLLHLITHRTDSLALLVSGMKPPVKRPWWQAGLEWLVSPDGQAWGAYATVLGLLGLVALAAAAYRVPATRRVVGIIWDVASFWPRSCHPLAAPCYAERTVPDLVTRVHYFCAADRPVVLAGHSQGSVISAATLAHLNGDRRTTGNLDSVSLLTFGCVLRRLYARYFPTYFGPAFLTDLQSWLPRTGAPGPRWINLWRYTDYLGGQVTDGPPQVVPAKDSDPVHPSVLLERPPVTGRNTWEWHSPDPPLYDLPAGSTTYLAPHRHSDFWSDQSGIFQLAAVTLAQHHEP